MKTSQKFEQAFNFFKKTYSYKMGGTQTVILPNGKLKSFDDRQFYKGRGAKYNSSIKHDAIGHVKVSRKDYSAFLFLLKQREQMKADRVKEQAVKDARIAAAKANGNYSFTKAASGNFIELSEDESRGKYFDVHRLAATLDISIKDAALLKSLGKTYVFAKQIATGRIIEIYHASLSCNDLNIFFQNASIERMAEFNHSEWASAPFAALVGQTENRNHFVC